MADIDEGRRDKFGDLLELYDVVRMHNQWTPQNLETLRSILGDTHPINESIRSLFQTATASSSYAPETKAKMLRLGETIIQSLPTKIGRFNREYTPRYAALNRTTPPTQLRQAHPDYVERRAGGSVTKFYKVSRDSDVYKQALMRFGPSVTVLQYDIPRGLRPKGKTSGQFIKSIANIVDLDSGDEISLNVKGIMEDVDRVNSGHVFI
jgi:hypothetical protein